MLNDRRVVFTGSGSRGSHVWSGGRGRVFGQVGAEEYFPKSEIPEGDITNPVFRYRGVKEMASGKNGLVRVEASVRNPDRLAFIVTNMVANQEKFPFNHIKAVEGNALELSRCGKRFIMTHVA